MSQPVRASGGRLLLALLLVVVLTLGAAPFTSAAPAALPLIDHFDGTQGPLDAVLGTPAGSVVGDLNVLGGERDILVTVLPGSLQSPYGMHVVVGNSLLSSSQDTGVFGQALVTYDGIDGNPSTLNPTGLGGLNLAQVGSGFALTSRLSDLPIDIIITVYTNGTSASSATVHLPGGQPSSAPPITHFVDFAAFTQAQGATSPANFASVGAIQLLINGFNDASDLTLEDFRVTGLDWGDLPDGLAGAPTYPTLAANNGPRHVIGSLYLGSLIDSEPNGQPSVGATLDDTTGVDDEDGVVRTPNVKWNAGANGGSVNVTVTGGPGCLSGWIDWNNNGNLLDAGDSVLSNVLVNTGTSTHTFTIPIDPHNGTFYARFRLFAPEAGGGCPTSPNPPTGQAVNGEVEDYQWGFGPNAVNVSSFGATASPAVWPWVGGAISSATVLLAGLRRLLRH